MTRPAACVRTSGRRILDRTGIELPIISMSAVDHENIHTAIPSFPAFDQLEFDLSVMEGLTLSTAEKKDFRLYRPGDVTTSAGPCLVQCL